jgi:transmembrane sensor
LEDIFIKSCFMSEEIHRLLGRYFSGEATVEEKDEVRAWASGNEEEFHQLEVFWTSAGSQEAPPFDTQAAWLKVDSRLSSAIPLRARVVPFRKWLAVVAAAACILLVAGIWWINRAPEVLTRTAIAALETIIMEDGTTVKLRKGSTVSYPAHFKGSERLVKLQGIAFFEVAHDAAKPFVIDAAEARVQVVGTSFSVATRPGEVELIVRTGRVKFSSASDPSRSGLVIAGERALLNASGLLKSVNSQSEFSSWTSGSLRFSNTPLPQVAQAVSDFYGVRVKINSTDSISISSEKVTASFTNQDLPSVIEELEQITSLPIVKGNDGSYIIRVHK